MPDLELVPMNDLIQELLKRCDHGVVVLLQIGRPAPDDTMRIRRFKGNMMICSSIALDAALWTVKEQWRQEKEVQI